MKRTQTTKVLSRTLAAGLGLLALAQSAAAQVRGVGDMSFEFNAPRRAGTVRVQFFDFSGNSLIDMPRLNIAIPYDATKTPDQNLVIKRNAIRAAVQAQFGGYTDATEPVVQAGVRATAFANRDGNANAGFRGFNMTNVPFDVQRNPNNARAIDRIMWGVTMTGGNTGELFDTVINRAPLRVDPLGGNCGHSRVSFENPRFNPLTADGMPAQWHAGIVVNDTEMGAVIGLSDLPIVNGVPDTSGAAIAATLYQHLPSSVFSFATVANPALTGAHDLKFDFTSLVPDGVTTCGVAFGTTSDSEGVYGTYALPTPGSFALLGAAALVLRRRR
ncbi:MAG: hypothetical protein JSR77_13920 [Planctomycetes bacterium]|nr:hypothetical protein [Planctomycetota bacterium]